MSTFSPILKPVGPVDLVLVEQIGKTLGQLIALAQVGVVGKESSQRFEMRLLDQLRQQTHQAPGQRSLIQQGLGRNFVASQDCSIKLPHETAR
ncbi:hypothetical protein D3C84_994880 [compost metagenome]